MSQRGVETLLGRLLTDRDFRERFYQEPGGDGIEDSIDVTTRELEAVRSLKESRIADFSKLLDARIVRAAMKRDLQTKGEVPSGSTPQSAVQ